MADIALVRTAQGLVPATDADRDIVQKWKAGQVIHGSFTKMRNARFHRKFFAMLDLAWDYWEPTGGLVPRQEQRGIDGFARFLARHAQRADAVLAAAQAYLEQLESERGERFPVVDKSREAFREWVIIEAGHFDLVQTPAGVKRKAKSISWASMDDTQFEPLYRDVFATCWRLVLAEHFESEADAMAAAELLGGFA